MASIFGKLGEKIGRGKAGERPGTEPAPPDELAPRREEHASPALEALVRQLETLPPAPSRPSVLDLGPALGDNVVWFSRFGGRFRVADLYRSLAADERLALSFHERPEKALEQLLPPDDGEGAGAEGGYDLVLAWDLLNYLDREQLEALGRHLGNLVRPAGLLLALVATSRQIPAEPRRFHVLDRATLRYTTPVSRPRKSPAWPPAVVGSSFPAFTVDRSYLLRHGIQEYLLQRRGGG